MPYIDEALKEQVQNKYEEMKKAALVEDFFDKEKLGAIKLFINEKPSSFVSKFTIGEDTVYLGTNDL